MKFNVTSPCAHCPFRKDVHPYLSGARAAELATQLSEDDHAWFACHETTTSRGRGVHHRQAAQCAGAMILQTKAGYLNVPMRLAYWIGILKEGDLNMAAPVFDTFDQFVNHHRGGSK